MKAAAALLPLVSSAVQRTRVRPTLNLRPDAGAHLAGTGPSTASLAVTL